MKIKWIGHSALFFEGSKKILIDPFLSGHPVAMTSIDGRFTMTPRLAAKAVELLKVPKVVPIHFDTFPAIESSPEEFKSLVGNNSEALILKPGDIVEM